MSRADRVLAVLDTSFWVLAYRAEIAANCLDLFEIVVPKAVEEEIPNEDPESARLAGFDIRCPGYRIRLFRSGVVMYAESPGEVKAGNANHRLDK